MASRQLVSEIDDEDEGLVIIKAGDLASTSPSRKRKAQATLKRT